MAHIDSENSAYQASRALWKTEVEKKHKIGFFGRLFGYLRDHKAIRKSMAGAYYYTAERKRAAYGEALRNNLSPVVDFYEGLINNGWGFLCRFWRDFCSLVLWLADMFIIVCYYAARIVSWLADLAWDVYFWVDGRKEKMFRRFVMFVIAVSGIVVFLSSITAYEYSYYGKTLGITKSKSSVYNTIEILGDKLSAASGNNISIDVERDMEFTKVYGFNLDIDTEEDILTTLTYMKDLQVEAYAVVVNNENLVILEDEETAVSLMKRVQSYFAPEKEGVEYTDIHYEQAVGIVMVNVSLGDIWNQDDAFTYITTGSPTGIETYTVGSSEDYKDIALALGLSEEELKAYNPDTDIESLAPGQVINVSGANPLVTVVTTEIATYLEDVKYGTSYIDNASIYEGETEVKSAGVLGSNEIVATIVRSNGTETSKEIITTTRVKNPVNEVCYRGVKEIPALIGTGVFKMPLKGNVLLTSKRGMRWGRMHEGVDWGVVTGTKVYASDGGVVTYAGWYSGLGYCVYINHGGLWTTVYGHCSRLLVSTGDQVYQGQNIALSGNTGNSTGAHLHFEIRYNGNSVDPLEYLEDE